MITTQRGSARRVVAIALFVLIALVYGVLALLVPPDGQHEAASIAGSETMLSFVHKAAMKDMSDDAATRATSRPDRVQHGSR